MKLLKETVMPEKKTTKAKKAERKNFDVAEFGKRLAMVREQLVGLSQSQFAPIVNTKQGLLSRLEAGIGGNIHMVFEIVDYLNRNGFQGYMLFREDFDIALFKNKVVGAQNKKVIVDELDAIEKAVLSSSKRLAVLKRSIV